MAKTTRTTGGMNLPGEEKRNGSSRPAESELLDNERKRRAALAVADYDEALRALEAEDPVAVAVTTEYISAYSRKAGALLKEGKDYFALLTDTGAVPSLERIAMEMVLEAFEDELNEDEFPAQ